MPGQQYEPEDEGFSRCWIGAGMAACLGTAVAGLMAWHWLKVRLLASLGELPLAIMPLPVGILMGWIAGRFGARRNWWLSSLAVILTVVVTLAGMVIEHRIHFDSWLGWTVRKVYDETYAFAGRVAYVVDDASLQRILKNDKLTALGEVATMVDAEESLSYWQRRNLLHVHLVITESRSPYFRPRDGLTRSIWEPTRLTKEVRSIGAYVKRQLGEEVPPAEVVHFRTVELPQLRLLLSGKPGRERFEDELKRLVMARIEDPIMMSEAFSFGTALFGLVAVMVCRWLSWQSFVTEEI